jgi:hypothetical protein
MISLTNDPGVYVSLIGINRTRVDEIAEEVVKETQGRLVSDEEARTEKQKAEEAKAKA